MRWVDRSSMLAVLAMTGVASADKVSVGQALVETYETALRGGFAMAYDVNAGTGEHWNVYAIKDVDGQSKLAGWFTVDFCDGCP